MKGHSGWRYFKFKPSWSKRIWYITGRLLLLYHLQETLQMNSPFKHFFSCASSAEGSSLTKHTSWSWRMKLILLQVGCFDYILRKTRHEKLVLNISVHTVKSAGGGHNPVEKECWTAYSFDQGMLADTSASVKSGTATLRLSWLLVAAMIGLTLIMGRR